jgi:3-oxoacyl-ACP reductase-like protein
LKENALPLSQNCKPILGIRTSAENGILKAAPLLGSMDAAGHEHIFMYLEMQDLQFAAPDFLYSMQAGRFEGKVVVVTGASSGMGLGAAELLAAEGAKIVAVGRRKDALAEAVEKIKAAGANAPSFPSDLRFTAKPPSDRH